MAATYEPIATTTLGSNQLAVEFTGISGSYTDLVMVFNGKSTQTGSANNALRTTVNGDNGSNYSLTQISGNGSSALSYRGSNQTYWDGDSIAQTSASPNTVIMNFMDYANTTTFKTVISRTSFAGGIVAANVSLWRSTSAITSIKFVRDGTNSIAAGSTFTLYGIKAA